MGAGSSTDHLRNTFFNIFFLDKDWKECDKFFQYSEVNNGQVLNNHECHVLYILSGEISMYYINRGDSTPNPANLLKVFQPGSLHCLHDSDDDPFETGRSLKMFLQCTSSNNEPTKYLCITKEKLMECLNSPHLQPLKTIFQSSPAALLHTNPLFRDLSLDQIHMIESCLRYVPIDTDSAITVKGMASNSDGGCMGILFHGKAIQKQDNFTPLKRGDSTARSRRGGGVTDEEQPPPLLSSNSIHSIGSTDRGMAKSPSKRMSMVPLSARGRHSKVNPTSTLQPGDKLLSIGSVIGAEVCLRRDMLSMKTVVAQSDCVLGLLSFSDLERIDAILPLTLRTLENNVKYTLLENLINFVPILHDITSSDLFSLSKRCHILSVEKDTPLLNQGDEGRRFYMILQGETTISITPSTSTSPSSSPSSASSCQFSLHPGAYFGEVAIILRKPLTASVTVTAGTILLYLERADYLTSFSRNHQSIAEVSIRLQGIDTPLLHIMRHSKGYQNFLQFLQSELAPEGAIFWHRVDQMEDQCAFWNTLQHPNQNKSIISNPKRYDPNMSTSRIKVPYPSSLSLSILGEEEAALGSSHSSKHNSVLDNSAHHVEHTKQLLHLIDEIMQQHILNDAPYQVNLPATMIKKMITGYNDIRTRMTEELKNESISPALYNEILQNIPLLFSQAKHEVFMLLKDDNYARWNKMESFQQFINEMKPYVF